jgi:Fe-S cluster assembly iron-binding protein IscA
LALEELQDAEDMIVESNGMKIVYAKELDAYINGLTLDYSDKWYNRGFRLANTAN